MLVLRGSWSQPESMAPVLSVCASILSLTLSESSVDVYLTLDWDFPPRFLSAPSSLVREGWDQSPGGEGRQASDHRRDLWSWSLWRHPLRCGQEHQEQDRQPDQCWQWGHGGQRGRQAERPAAQVGTATDMDMNDMNQPQCCCCCCLPSSC